MSYPSNLDAIRAKVRKITGRPSQVQISNAQIDEYVNTFYRFDMPEHLRLQNLRVNYEFTTTANIPVYDFPKDSYLTNMPPLYIGGYQSYMTQTRENFFRINPQLNYLQQSVYTGNGTPGPYTGQFLINTPIVPGFKPNPPGAYSSSTVEDIAGSQINWNVLVSALGTPHATSGISPSISLVDDGQGNLFSPDDASTNTLNARGTINYITGAINITNFPSAIPSGAPINVQYIPYVASRPQQAVFFQDQFILWPIPDQAYTVSIEVYKYPTALSSGTQDPQLQEWWQLLAYGAADKIFADNADFENMEKFRPLMKEQMDLVNRRTLVQQTPERTATIYTEQSQFPQYPFGNLFSGF
ncbi:hypothetical protein HC928_02785 [bacterium]|nr:hypothetical protein [bacterium]